MPNLQCPIMRRYLNKGCVCIVNQLFGENANQLFYGADGHRGVDLKTQGTYKYRRYDSTETGQHWCWKKEERTPEEKQGFIPIVAVHSGQLTTNVFYQDRKLGWGMFITWKEDGKEWRFLNWHIERPWRSLGTLWQGVKLFFKPEQVNAGAIIAITGNTGYSTGPHFHGQLEEKVGDVWVQHDPILHFKDTDIVYQYYQMTTSRWFYCGKEYTQEEAKQIITKIENVC